jgi:hypothetical protein
MAKTDSNAFDVRINVPTPLATAAAALGPGEWAEFTSPTYVTGATKTINPNKQANTLAELLNVSTQSWGAGDKRCTEYSDKMVWDSTRRKVYFTGGGHGQSVKTIVYDEFANQWTDLGEPSWWTPGQSSACHAYQHNCFDGKDTHYFTLGQSNTSYKRNVDSGNTWTAFSHGMLFGTDGLIGSMEFFPTMGAAGSIVFTDWAGIRRWDLNSKSASTLGNPNLGTAGYQQFGVYSPIKDIMYIGGGYDPSIYTISSSGTISSKRTSCPANLGVIAAINTVDPVSGHFLAITNDSTVRIFNNDTNSWSTDTAPPSGFWTTSLYSEGVVQGIVAAPMYDYGVTMFITIERPAIYLRKGR